MRKLILTIFLAALASNAVAGWTFSAGNDNSSEYVDTDSKWYSDGTVKMWTLRDFRQLKSLGDNISYLSSIDLYEFDCVKKRARSIQGANFQGQMREGKIVYSGSEINEWRYVLPGSFGEESLKIACKR